MVVDMRDEQQVSDLFHALADSTRRDIVARVLGDAQSVSSLANHYAMSFAAVQKHVAVLERAGLVTKRSVGRERLVSGNVATLRKANRLLEQLEKLWTSRMDRFNEVLINQTKGAKK